MIVDGEQLAAQVLMPNQLPNLQRHKPPSRALSTVPSVRGPVAMSEVEAAASDGTTRTPQLFGDRMRDRVRCSGSRAFDSTAPDG